MLARLQSLCSRAALIVPLFAVAVALTACESKVRSSGERVQATAPTSVEPSTPVPVTEAPIEAEPESTVAAGGVPVAVLLPLSGPNAALGRALLDAAQLAVFDIGDEKFTLLPRDTGGTPEGASAAADSAIAAGARLIIGPVFATEAPAVAARAQPAGISVLCFSNDITVAAPGVFIMGIPPRAQVDRVIAFARSRGLSSYAALLPDNGYGAIVENALRDAAARVGGQIAAVERYDPGTNDASAVVRRLASYESRRASADRQRRQLQGRDDEISREAMRRLQGVETIGEVGFDSVLMPDFGDRLLAIAPLLPYYDIDPARVRLLGSTLWDDPRVAREPSLAGGWFAAPPPEARDHFVKRYRELYKREPPRIATIAYDAVALAAVLARAETGPDFSVNALTNPVGFAGTDGVFRLRPDGSIERNLAVLEVQRSGFRTVSPAPESFAVPTQ